MTEDGAPEGDTPHTIAEILDADLADRAAMWPRTIAGLYALATTVGWPSGLARADEIPALIDSMPPGLPDREAIQRLMRETLAAGLRRGAAR